MSTETICPICQSAILSECGCQKCDMSAEELGVNTEVSKEQDISPPEYYVSFVYYMEGSEQPVFSKAAYRGTINTTPDVQALNAIIFEHASNIAGCPISHILVLAWMEVNKFGLNDTLIENRCTHKENTVKRKIMELSKLLNDL